MKKTTYLVAPLMVLPFLVGCGGGNTPVPPEDITYKVSVSDKSDKHLKFLSEDNQDLNQVKAKNGESFKFKIEAEKVEDTQYTVVKDYVFVAVGSDVLTDGVEIYWDGENEADHSKAIVTIDAAKVTGDIVVGAKAGIKDHYLFACPILSGLGEPEITPKDEKHPGYIKATEKATITFPSKTVNAVTPKLGAFIDIDGFGYDAPEAYLEDYTGISFDYTKYQITIDPNDNKVVPHDSFSIIARSTGDETWLESFDWADIKYISENGLAEKFFTEGDQKTVTLTDGLEYPVRIIGFNHDTLASDESKKAGITFQFGKLISDKNKSAITKAWGTTGTCHQNFINSTFNKDYLNGELYNKLLPNDLREAIVPVVKKVGVYSTATTPKWKPTEYTPYLFPLAYEEVKKNAASDLNVDEEGTIYSFFSNATNKDRVLTDLNGKAASYWLRSPSTEKDSFGTTKNRAFEVYSDGTIYAAVDGAEATESKGVAPCFCI